MITISRADVTSDFVLEDLPNAFLKLPITTYMESIDVDPLPSQIALINAVNKYRFVCAAISRRQGKTYIANIIGQVVALVPGSNILIMSPNYNLSMISWELQRRFIKFHKIEVDKDNAKDRVIELANGSTIRMGSVNQVDSCVGRSYDLIIFDEAALTSDGEDAFNVSLRPTLDRDNARAIFISTPRGKTNWFAKFWNRGFDIGEEGHETFPQWCSIKATWRDNPRMTIEDVEDAKRSMSEAEFNQEYNADFNSYEGQIWNLSEDCIHDHEFMADLTDPENNLHHLDKIGGMDLGFNDPTALCVIGYSEEFDKYYVLDEYYAREKSTSKHAEAVQALIEKWGIDFIYIDSAAQQTRFDFARDYDIPTINAKKAVNDGIGHVASIVDRDKLIVPPHLKETLRAFDAYRWDPNPNLIKEKPLHDSASHMADAIRYALYSFDGSVGNL
jgi:phage terminase large subunit